MVFDPYAPEFLADPYPTYSRMLSEGRVHATTCGIRAVCHFDDCARILRDPRWGVSQRLVDPVRRMFTPVEEDSGSLAKLDPPDHTELRRLLQPAFRIGSIAAFAGRLRTIAEGLVDEIAGRDLIDLVSDYALPFTVRTICTLMGVPEERTDDLVRWNRLLSQRMELAQVDNAVVAARSDAAVRLRQLFADLAHAERWSAGDHLLSRMATACRHGRLLRPAELGANAALVSMAAQEPTVSFIAGGIHALLSGDAECRLRFGDRSTDGVPAMDELIRFVSPVQMRPRVATTELVVDRTRFAPGDQVLVVIAAANRDPCVFEEPDRLDLTRPNRHLAFGVGRHMCLGAHLAQLQASVAVTALIRRFPDLQPASVPVPVSYERRFSVRRPARIVVERRPHA